MRVLLAGPGTGKTSRIKSIIDDDFPAAKRILVLSFTNATVNDLRRDFKDYEATDCATLHSFAFRINPLGDRYVLDTKNELPIIEKLAQDLEVGFSFLCELLGCISFDAMVSECLTFLRDNPEYAAKQVGALDLLVVDEYQDFNERERALVDAISEHAQETIILGDDDQSIYSFKDADPHGIIDLYSREDVARVPHEHLCHRCPAVVVKQAATLIAHNKIRVEKPWKSTGKPGNSVTRQFMSQSEACEYIVREITRIRAEDDPNAPSSILLLSPVSYYVDDLTAMLDEHKLGYVNFWLPPILEDDWRRLWKLRAIYGSTRLLNLIFLRGTLSSHFRKKFKGVLADAVRGGLNAAHVTDKATPFFGEPFSTFLSEPPSLQQIVEQDPGFAPMVARLDESDLQSSVDSLIRELNAPKEFDPSSVNIMSIHRSKGLQANHVFINGLVEGVLPNGADGVDTIEAQRRLLYVGVTRALDALHLLSPVEWDGRYVHRLGKSQFSYDYPTKVWNGCASRFLGEMRD